MDCLISGNKRLRIWHIAETYPPDYGGGAAIYIQDICRLLAERGHEVRVLCVENSDAEPYTLRTDYNGKVRVERINLPYFKTEDPDGWRLGLLRWLKHQRRIAQIITALLSEWRPDIVHYNTARPLGEECLTAIHRQGIPLVAMLHEAWLVCPRIMLLRSPASQPCNGPAPARCLECMYSYYDNSHWRAIMKLPWRIAKLGVYPAYRLWRRAAARKHLLGSIGVSKFMTRVHAPHLRGPVQHIPLGINLAVLPSSQVRQRRKPLRFGFVAGFQQHKGIHDILDATASLKREGYDFELHVWGPNQESGAAEVAARGLEDRVLLRGLYQSEDIWNIYAEMDVAIMATTVCEPFGRIPLEAAAAGIPTIAPSIGGITESIRDGVDGLLYRFRDSAHLKRQMQRVLEEPGLVERLIENLQPVPDTKNSISAIEEFYYSALGHKPQPKLTAEQARVAVY